MKFLRIISVFILLLVFFASGSCTKKETPKSNDERMEWWREARFGLFIHWGLYAIPAGEWDGKTNYAEWIRNNAHIPLEVYDQFVHEFNPVKFNAKEWVRMAKDAGMKYIVITSKHHDGFCLFDSKYTDFDVMSTPFQRDIMKELADASHEAGIKICWYHSIMDWHHPDYLPRREWEKDRPTEGADFDRYVHYMKSQLSELLSNYGDIGVLWFDGEWESTWNHERGKDLYHYVRGLQPDIIVNNRVDVNRGGMAGISSDDSNVGDFGTPEQQIPATGLPGVDWETCMTMNNHWGYNKNDHDWKSTKQLLQMLADIASKGGNFLLNVGPTAEGLFPQPSIDRLKGMGQWMKVNGEAIYDTKASPFKKLDWGRCTQKVMEENTRLYLHVFDWPDNGELAVPGIYNKPVNAYLLSDPEMKNLNITRNEDALSISIPKEAPDSINSVIVLDVTGKPDIANPPVISADFDEFIDQLRVDLSSDRENVSIHYTLDGTDPAAGSPEAIQPIILDKTTVVSARCFRDGKAVSGIISKEFRKIKPLAAVNVSDPKPGILYKYFEGDWDLLPEFASLQTKSDGVLNSFTLKSMLTDDYFGFEYTGYIRVPQTGMYEFSTVSDDGSRLYIGDKLVVDNDGLHGSEEKTGVIGLAEGFHPIRVTYFEKTGGNELSVLYRGPDITNQEIPGTLLFH
jgi:alpha-L-fucosidase